MAFFGKTLQQHLKELQETRQLLGLPPEFKVETGMTDYEGLAKVLEAFAELYSVAEDTKVIDEALLMFIRPHPVQRIKLFDFKEKEDDK